VKHRPVLALAAVLTAVSLSGCGLLDNVTGGDSAAPIATPAGAAPTPEATPTSDSGTGDSVKDQGNIPDVCKLMTKSDVQDLTGRAVTQIDEDGASDGDAVRYCQWQQESGQLAVFLGRTTEDEFKIKIEGAEPVDGVGQDAYLLAGHLYVLYGTVQVDVYNRGGSDAENLEQSKKIVDFLIPKI
jgi:hypothetical protein